MSEQSPFRSTSAPSSAPEGELAPVPLNWPKGPVAIPAAKPATSNTASPTASLVLGLLALLTCWIPLLGIVAWIFAPLGLLFGFLGLSTPGGRTMSIVGLSISGIALLVCFAWLAFFAAA